VITKDGKPIGDDSVEFLQAGRTQEFRYYAVEPEYTAFGGVPTINALATMTFEDIDETKWAQDSNARLLRFPLLSRWRRKAGRRHVGSPRSTP
jgi:hypothetical protein